MVEHELGHVAGSPTSDASVDALMSGLLPTGVRRIATAADIDALFASPGSLI